MTPQREWLKRGEIIVLIDERIQPLISQLRETQRQNHEENRSTLREIKGQNETQLARMDGRDEALKEYEECRQKIIAKWLKRLAYFVSPGAVYEVINFIHRLWLWHATGHFFAITPH